MSIFTIPARLREHANTRQALRNLWPQYKGTAEDGVRQLDHALKESERSRKNALADLGRMSIEAQQQRDRAEAAEAIAAHPMKGRPRDAKGHFLPVIEGEG